MAAHYRVAATGTKLGQPEVNLGLIPGGQGTQRLPRLVGLAKAVEMCISGAPIDSSEAKDLGLVDQIIDGNLLAGAIAFAKEVSARSGAHPKASELRTKLGTPSENAAILEAGRKQATKLLRNMFAPLAALEALEAATVLPFEEGCKKEAELFQRCLASSQAKALIHAFLGEREVAKVPDIPSDTPALPIKKVGVVGAGTMGTGITMAFANSGFPVLLEEVDPVALERGMARIHKNYENSVNRGRIRRTQSTIVSPSNTLPIRLEEAAAGNDFAAFITPREFARVLLGAPTTMKALTKSGVENGRDHVRREFTEIRMVDLNLFRVFDATWSFCRSWSSV